MQIVNRDPSTLVFFTKDKGSYAVVSRVALAALQRGLHVKLYAEGPALELAQQSDQLRGCLAVWDHQAAGSQRLLQSDRPRAVIVGCSSPINDEQHAANAAQLLAIPLVILSDITGAWKRVRSPMDALVVVTDSADAMNVSRLKDRRLHVHVGGNHQIVIPASDTKLKDRIDELRRHGGLVVNFMASGQPARAMQELECVLASSAMTVMRHVLLFKPNDKIFDSAKGPQGAGPHWKRRFEEAVRGKAIWLEGPTERYAEITIAPSSGCLTALAAGKIGVGLRCATVEDVLARESGVLDQLERYEHEIRMAIMREPCDLTTFAAPRWGIKIPKPFDGEEVLDRILRYSRP